MNIRNLQKYENSSILPNLVITLAKREWNCGESSEAAKMILKLSNDPWLAILEQRNTPGELASKNEKLMSRRTRTTLPIKSELLAPVVVPTKSIVKATVKKKQQNNRYYDRVSKPLQSLVVGEHIRT